MTLREPSVIGRVRQVLGARVTIELDPELAGTSPILGGKLHRVGQIGSIVRIPQGTLDLLASVTMVGISELAGPPPPGSVPSQGDRWLQVQLLGERDALGRFSRGVSSYPALDDQVHLTTREDLAGVFPNPGNEYVPVGLLSTADHQLSLHLGRLVMRHTVVVGSTGSGKSSTVARILQNIVDAGLQNSNIVIVDPHGEYTSAFGERATVRSVLESDPDHSLWVPYWALGPEDLLHVYAGGRGADSPTVKTRFIQEVLGARQRFLRDSGWSSPSPEDVSTESPVPFDLRQVWWELDYADRATYRSGRGQGDICEEDGGNPASLIGATFEPYQVTGAPYQGPTGVFGAFRPLVERIKARLADPLYQFLERRLTEPTSDDPLPGIMSQWLGGTHPISILDFSGVPSEASDIAIGAVLALLFQAAISSPSDAGVGRNRPILIVLEEAHRFIGPESAAGLARTAVERIAREGRKYGVGLFLVTQRPSEMSETALSQCGTVIAHRLTNPKDQSRVESTLPDSVAELANVLPSLRTGEALVTGESVALPSRVLVDRPSPAPTAADPSLEPWRQEPSENDLATSISRMRGSE